MAGARPGPHDPAVATAVQEALVRRAWRGMPATTVARIAVGAADRHAVVGFVAGVPGIAVDSVAALELAAADDLRVIALTRHLEGRSWRARRVRRLCADLAAALTRWQAERDAFHATLRSRREA